jgi:transposase-like protein
MTTTIRTRRRFPDDEKRRLVLAWRKSGRSQCQFAREHGIPPSYLSRWSSEQCADECEVGDAVLTPVRVMAVGVKGRPVKSTPGSAKQVHLRMPCGFVDRDDAEGDGGVVQNHGNGPCRTATRFGQAGPPAW